MAGAARDEAQSPGRSQSLDPKKHRANHQLVMSTLGRHVAAVPNHHLGRYDLSGKRVRPARL